MPKSALTIDEQVELLESRGMEFPADRLGCKTFLETTNYYRFSGYFRYWQVQPTAGRNDFIEGTSFDSIRKLYSAEQELVAECVRVLRLLELVLRTQFAYQYAHRIGATGVFVEGLGFSPPPHDSGELIQEFILQDLDRSNESFICRYREVGKTNERGQFLPSAYRDMPIWVAVEVLSFGTLSRCLGASEQSGVTQLVADNLKVARGPFVHQIRSFVYLRNRCAHHARIWNHSVIDAPGMHKKVRRRAIKEYGKFDHRSVFSVLVAIDLVLRGSGIEKEWLKESVWPVLESNELLKVGIMNPKKYEDFDPRRVR